MAFPSLNTPILSKVFADILGDGSVLKGMAVKLRQRATTEATSVDDILMFVRGVRAARGRLVTNAAVPGIEAYATSQMGAASNIAAEYSALLARIDATLLWIATNLPKDANGYIQGEQIANDGAETIRTFPSSSLGGLRTVLDALNSQIA